MMMRYFLITFLFCILFSFQPAFTQTVEDFDGVKRRVEGNTAFALDLYARLKDRPGNLVFCPQSLFSVLAMTFAGAGGTTRDQMAGVLRLSRSLEEEYKALSVLGRGMQSAQAVWLQEGFTLSPEYTAFIEKYHAEGIHRLDFRDHVDQARKTINEWMEMGTDGLLPECIRPGELMADVEVALTDAVYFGEKWKNRFHPDNTADRVFHLEGGNEVSVPFMFQNSLVGYFVGEEVEILQIPFAEKDRSMILLLPRALDGLKPLEERLTPERLAIWCAGLCEQKMGFFIPRFRIDSRLSLEKTLAAMGMAHAFSARTADFKPMTGEEGYYIDRVIHAAAVDVTEEGVEAAAGSAVMIKRKGPGAFRADHPFLFLIRDEATGNLLFIGRVADPADLRS